MATTSQVGAALDGLYTAAAAALSATVTVVDGPPLSWGPLVVPDPPGAVTEDAYLFIGAIPDDDTSADAQQERNTAGTGRVEDLLAHCTAYARDGAGSAKTARDAALAIVAAVEQVIRGDQTLGGAVAISRVAQVDRLDQLQTTDGADCLVLFTVAARAFLR
jgi:hypothetical protein